ncbi:hypothetical protein [Calothrix sp. 336/3]|uniref:hypothetical protein n=1 Tax=Calothrix sp. 336/3 TaxID=1337936 RepID=UPI0004E3405F|nr:hypothetical protein [Calothrix sp. 336/3]AKG23620.1 hypothetical protein IJ00_22105 [Calothrix sp. 336/3]
MWKLVSAALVSTSILLNINPTLPAFAGTCASKCGTRPLQFTPGKSLYLEVTNKTPNTVIIQKPGSSDPIALQPGRMMQLYTNAGTEPNMSLLFWSDAGLSLQANVSKHGTGTLRVELRPTWRVHGDRAVYIMDDGRVNVL